MTDHSTPHDGGFSLIEVLIAISLLGLASVIILGALVDTRAREASWTQRQRAIRVGQNAIELWTHLRQSQGQEKGGYHWAITLQPHHANTEHATAQTVEVVATVRWKDGAHEMSSRHQQTRLIRGAP